MCWRKHYEKQLKEEFNFLNEYEEKLRHEDDPRRRKRWEAEIQDIKQRIEEYEAKLQRLNEQSSNQEQPRKIADFKQDVSSWDWLTQTLEAADIEVVQEAYLECRNPDFLQGKDNPVPNQISYIVANLANMPSNKSDFSPIWLFVFYLSETPNVSENIRRKLQVQIQKQLDENLQQQLTKKVRTIKEQNKKHKNFPINPYLMLQIRPHHYIENRYFVTGWLLADDICDSSREFIDIGITNFYFDSRFKEIALQEKGLESHTSPLMRKQPEGSPWHDIKNFISSIINFSTGILNRQSDWFQLTVEFFLPQELLNEPVDSWELDDEYGCGKSLPIGYDYKVVVRSNTRLSYRYPYRNLWREKWEQVTQNETKLASECFFSTTECPDDPTNFFYQIQQQYFLGCSLQAALLAASQDNFFWCIYHAGIPIALWLRRHLYNLNYQDEIQNLLDCTIAELPEAVWKQRRVAREQQVSLEEHIGYHLSLWWDNPYRLPPEQLLKSN